MMRRFFRELFARENADMTDDPDFHEIEGDGHPPSIYDTLIDGLDGDLRGLTSLRAYHSEQVETLDATIKHKREQRVVLATHRAEERREPKPVDPFAPGTVHGAACGCQLCRQVQGYSFGSVTVDWDEKHRQYIRDFMSRGHLSEGV